MRRYLILISLLITCLLASGQHPLLQCGPMPGFSDMNQVRLWVQTTSAAEVKFGYVKADGNGVYMFTDAIGTRAIDGFTAELVADSLEEGNEYHFDLYINGELVQLPWPTTFTSQTHWQYRKDPPPFRLLAGSCAYVNEHVADRPGTPYGSNYHIFETMHRYQPDLMVWLGDNVYFREPDWFSKQGMIHRYTHSRSIPEIQPFLASTHHYAIWDDHDYGPNNSDRGFFLKDTALEVFDLFWPNPTVGVPGIEGAVTHFQWSDIDFFLLDNRYNRAPDRRVTGERTILGAEQKQWLIDALRYSRAPYKIVAMGGQFLNTARRNETYSNFGYDKERQEIIDLIYTENIRGVVFLTGDRHHSELSILKEEGKPAIFDITSSPLTAGAHTLAVSEVNELRVDGSLVMTQSFAVLDFSGPRTDRVLRVIFVTHSGEEVFTYSIRQEDL